MAVNFIEAPQQCQHYTMRQLINENKRPSNTPIYIEWADGIADVELEDGEYYYLPNGYYRIVDWHYDDMHIIMITVLVDIYVPELGRHITQLLDSFVDPHDPSLITG